MISGDVVEGWFDLMNGEEVQGQINLSVQYIPKINLDEVTHEIENSYFSAKEGCRMVLYQDAITPQLPQFDGLCHPDGSSYEATSAWRDLYECIQNAQKFIYITGWSVYTGIQLQRGDDDPDGLSNVGELLKSKAEDGVRVLVLLWNEALSEVAGLMGTHDNDTKSFFDDSKVECILAPRQMSDGLLANAFVSSCYTHHQKTVICDAAFEDDESLKRVVAFIGGLDITDGRYDSPEFPLFKTIKTLHQGDFYQNNFPGVTEDTGPRQPWVGLGILFIFTSYISQVI